ncbi:MAG: serine hydrolase, partial [Gemmatimonadota bacterium]
MRRTATLAGVLALSALATAWAASGGRSYELRAGRWWTGRAFEPRTMYSVDGVFTRHRPARVDSVLDLRGRYIVPPYAEAHTHSIAYVRSRIHEFLELGVFYALVMNVHRSTIGESFTWFNRRNSVDVNFTSVGVTASDGHPIQIGLRSGSTPDDVDGDWVTVIETPADLDAKWPALRDANPDLIKLFLLYSDRYAERHGDTTIAFRYKGMDPSLVELIVERAHDDGLRVAAHVRTGHDFHVAVDAGVDIVAHLPGFSMGPGSVSGFEDPDRMADIEHPEWFRIRAADAALAAERGITVIPTIGRLRGTVPDTLPPEIQNPLRRLRDARKEVLTANLRLLRENGERIAIGSDAGEGNPVNEALVVHELGVFDEAEILRMLTEHAARVTFPRRSIGRLEEGYEASFLALAGDPTERFGHVRDVVLRFKQGEPLDLSVVVPGESPPDGAGAAVPSGTRAAAGVFAQTCSDREPAFREILDEFQSRQRNVGLAAAVLLDGRLVYAEAFGWSDRERAIRATIGTRFGVASITKAFTGLTLLRLAAEGGLNLAAEIQRYIPEFPRHPAGPVTVRQVAAQLGGIRHWGPERDTLYDRRFDDVEDILPLFLDDPYAQAPGAGYSYSSYAYNLLAIAMERATGERFQDLVETRVIEPLGLESVAFDEPGLGGDLRAARYSYYDLEDYHELSEPVRVPERDYSHNMAGGNMVADVVDLVRFGEAVRRPGFLTDEEYRSLWTRPRIDGVESPMSFGWFVREDGNRLAISGSNPGLQAGMAVWRDEGILVAVIANSWGIGSRSAELVDDDPEGLLGRLAAVCADPPPAREDPRSGGEDPPPAREDPPPARAHHRLVPLPDGGVMLIGGSTRT